MGFLEPDVAKEKEEIVEELYGIERPGLVDKYLDLLDFAVMGGMAQIARKAAKRNVLKSLKEFWSGKPGRESWENVKRQFEPISKALDELPQSELDFLRDIRTEKRVGELSDISPSFKGLLFGTYSPTKEEIVLSSMLSNKEARNVLFHEVGHSGSLGGAAKKRRIGTQAAVRMADELRRKKGLGYSEDLLEHYANRFADRFEELGGKGLTRAERLQEAHIGAGDDILERMMEEYPEELDDILRSIGGLD